MEAREDLINAINSSRIEDLPKVQEEVARTFKLTNDSIEDNNSHRNTLVCWMRTVVSLWLMFTALVVLFLYSKVGYISDSVMCTLLSTTTVNVLGLAVIVLRGLFNKK